MPSSRKPAAPTAGGEAGLVAGISAASCSLTASVVLAASSGSSSSKTTTLTLWQYGKLADSASYMPKVISNFEAANPGVKIKVVEQPGDTYFAQLHTAMISKTAPDIADLFAGSYLSQLIPYLTNLNERGRRRSAQERQGRQLLREGHEHRERHLRCARRRSVLQRLLQQGSVQEGRHHEGADDLERALRGLHEAQGQGNPAVRLRRAGWRRRDGHARGRQLPRLGVPAEAVERPLQRHRQVRHADDGQASSSSGRRSTPTSAPTRTR